MKKITRTERRAMIERGKTAAIIVLCLCCAFFLYSIWDLYKGQVSIGQAFWGTDSIPAANSAKTKDVVNSFKDFIEPEIVMVGQANNRAVLSPNEDLYTRALIAINDVMKGVYETQAESFEMTDRDLWQNVISNGIIYVKYPCVINTAFEKPFVVSGESGMAANIVKYEDVMIIPNPSADKGVTVFLKNMDTMQNFKVELTSSAVELRNIIGEYRNKKNNSLLFAHELNLDVPRTDESGESAVVLDSMFIIPLERAASANIVATVPRTYVQGIDFSHTNDFTTGLLNVFGYNPNTVRQYADRDGSVIFVGDTGSLSIHPGGRIEYKALGENEGISFMTPGRVEADPRGVMSGINEIMEAVFSISGMDEEGTDAELRITEMPDMTNSGELKVCMDYFANSKRIMLGKGPAVEARIKNGAMVELKMIIKSVKTTNGITTNDDAFSAIDEFCEKNPKCKTIKRGSLVYKAFEDGKEASAKWQIQGE